MKDNNIEVFHNQLEVMTRVKELRKLGYKEEDMYIISSDERNISMLRGSTDIVIKEEEDSVWDRFKSFLKGEDSITEAFTRMRLSDQDKEFYHNEVKEGKIILYIDKDYGSYYELQEDGVFRPVVSLDENITPIEDIPESIKEDIGIEGNPDIERMEEKINKDKIIEDERNKIR